MLELLDYAKSELDVEFKPDGYNIGVQFHHVVDYISIKSMIDL